MSKQIILKISFVLLGLGIGVLGINGLNKRFSLNSLNSKPSKEEREEHLNAILFDNSSSQSDILRKNSLLELFNDNYPKKIDSALKIIDSSDESLKPLAYRLLAIQNESINWKFVELALTGISVRVKIEMLDHLVNLSDVTSKNFIKEYLDRNNSNQLEKIYQIQYESLWNPNYKIDDSKKRILLSLIQNDNIAEVQARALKALVETFSINEEDLTLIKKFIVYQNNPMATLESISYLSRVKDPWFKSQIIFLMKSKFEEVKLAAVSSLKKMCPDEKWIWLYDFIIKEESDFLVEKSIQEISFFEKSESVSFIEKLLNKKILNRNLKEVLNHELNEILNQPKKTIHCIETKKM